MVKLSKSEFNNVLNSIRDVKFKKDKILALATQGYDKSTIAKLLGATVPYVYMVTEGYAEKKLKQVSV